MTTTESCDEELKGTSIEDRAPAYRSKLAPWKREREVERVAVVLSGVCPWLQAVRYNPSHAPAASLFGKGRIADDHGLH